MPQKLLPDHDTLVFLDFIYICFHNLCHDAHILKDNIIQIVKGKKWADSKDVAFKERHKGEAKAAIKAQNY